MVFQRVSGKRVYFKYAECDPGQKLVDNGIYIGPEDGKFGVQHIFRQADNQIVVLNSSGHLNWLLEKYDPTGKACNVFYADKVVLPSGTFKGKEAHNFELEIDDAPVKSQMPKDVAAAMTDDISL